MKHKKTAIIFGITGQDGAYLSHFLLQKGYKVIGVTRNKSPKNLFRLKKLKMIKKIRILKESGFINNTQIASLAIGLHQFTRPFIFDQSYYYQESLKLGRHNALKKYLSNFLNSFSPKT